MCMHSCIKARFYINRLANSGNKTQAFLNVNIKMPGGRGGLKYPGPAAAIYRVSQKIVKIVHLFI